MGFTYAGNLGGAGAPVVRRLFAGEAAAAKMYVGQLVGDGKVAGEGGHVQIADVAAEANDDTLKIIGMTSGIVDDSRVYTAATSGTAQYGDNTTCTATQATVLSTGAPELDVILIVPGVTLVRAPIYNAAWGTALTEQVVTTASSGGTLVTAASNAITNIADDYATVYCRSGANRGIYRIATTTTTTVQTVTVPFPYGTVVGDKFVTASCVLGIGGLDFPATADCIDGNNDMDSFFDVYYHEINLEETGKEYAIFSLWPGYHTHT